MKVDFASKVSFIDKPVDGSDAPPFWPCVKLDSHDDYCEFIGFEEDDLSDKRIDLQVTWPDTERVAYLLGEDGKIPNSQRLISDPGKVHPFSEKLKEAIEYVRQNNDDNGFAEALKEAVDLTMPKYFEAFKAMKEEYRRTENAIIAIVDNMSKATPEFDEDRAAFVPISVTGSNDKLFWPATLFHDGKKLVDGLTERGLVPKQGRMSLLEQVLSVAFSSQNDATYAFLFGDPPSGENVIAVTVRQQVIGYNSPGLYKTKLHVQYQNEKCWTAFQQLLFSLEWSSGKPMFSNVQFSAAGVRRTAGEKSATSRRSSSVESVSSRAKVPSAKQRASITSSEENSTGEKQNRSGHGNKTPNKRALSNVTNKKQAPTKKSKKRKIAPPDKIYTSVDEDPYKQFDGNWIEVLPTFDEVKHLLEEAGYVFHDGLYCLPGKDPLKNPSDALEGTDYFKTESDFREHLCINKIALPKNKFKRDVNNKYLPLEAWVRYHRVEKLLSSTGTSLLSVTRLNKNDFNSLLTNKLGFEWRPRWKIPGKKGLYEHCEMKHELARRGLPPECNLSEISDEELLAIELYFSSPRKDELLFFYRI